MKKLHSSLIVVIIMLLTLFTGLTLTGCKDKKPTRDGNYVLQTETGMNLNAYVVGSTVDFGQPSYSFEELEFSEGYFIAPDKSVWAKSDVSAVAYRYKGAKFSLGDFQLILEENASLKDSVLKDIFFNIILEYGDTNEILTNEILKKSLLWNFGDYDIEQLIKQRSGILDIKYAGENFSLPYITHNTGACDSCGELLCSHCKGTGRLENGTTPCDECVNGKKDLDCSSCTNGTADVACTTCSGTGGDSSPCTTCNGDGQCHSCIKCGSCDAEREVRCNVCSGAGSKPTKCSSCNGVGTKTCQNHNPSEMCQMCFGDGKYLNTQDPCNQCSATGKNCRECLHNAQTATCAKCDGNGTTGNSSCSNCYGYGRVPCPDCGGACSSCNQSRQCKTCKATGVIKNNCATCAGLGKVQENCSVCAGVGHTQIVCDACGGSEQKKIYVECSYCGSHECAKRDGMISLTISYDGVEKVKNYNKNQLISLIDIFGEPDKYFYKDTTTGKQYYDYYVTKEDCKLQRFPLSEYKIDDMQTRDNADGTLYATYIEEPNSAFLYIPRLYEGKRIKTITCNLGDQYDEIILNGVEELERLSTGNYKKIDATGLLKIKEITPFCKISLLLLGANTIVEGEVDTKEVNAVVVGSKGNPQKDFIYVDKDFELLGDDQQLYISSKNELIMLKGELNDKRALQTSGIYRNRFITTISTGALGGLYNDIYITSDLYIKLSNDGSKCRLDQIKASKGLLYNYKLHGIE